MANVLDELYYSTDHLWVRPLEGGDLRVGITDYAQESLGDIVAVTPPRAGDTIEAGRECGDLESTKSVSDLIAPVTGRVSDPNPAVTETPELINSDPYLTGWLFDVQIDAGALAAELSTLLDAAPYRRLIGG